LLSHARTNTLLKPLYAHSGDENFTPFRSISFNWMYWWTYLRMRTYKVKIVQEWKNFSGDHCFVCKCSHSCHFKVHIEEAFRISRMYYSLDDDYEWLRFAETNFLICLSNFSLKGWVKLDGMISHFSRFLYRLKKQVLSIKTTNMHFTIKFISKKNLFL